MQQPPIISIIHPSMKRPKMAYNTANKWINSCLNSEHIEYILSVPKSDPRLQHYIDLFSGLKVKLIQDRCSNMVLAVNAAIKHTRGRIFVIVSDDFDCPMHWDNHLIDSLNECSDFVLKTDDGLQPFIVTLPIMDRVYYERFGYIYNPDYLHMFCDTELTAVSFMLNKLLTRPIIFRHNHYTTGKMRKDEVNVKNNATVMQGRMLFLKRRSMNFGLSPEDIINPYPADLMHI